jgi:hypothetical protein
MISGSVIWICPKEARARETVMRVAESFSDDTVAFRFPDNDIHPISYEELAESIRTLVKRQQQ